MSIVILSCIHIHWKSIHRFAAKEPGNTPVGPKSTQYLVRSSQKHQLGHYRLSVAYARPPNLPTLALSGTDEK